MSMKIKKKVDEVQTEKTNKIMECNFMLENGMCT